MSDQTQSTQTSLFDDNLISKLHPVYITNYDFSFQHDGIDFFYIKIMDYINIEHSNASATILFNSNTFGPNLKEIENVEYKLNKQNKSLGITHEIPSRLYTTSLLYEYTIKELPILLTPSQYELLEKHLGKNDDISKMIINYILDLYVVQVSRTLKENINSPTNSNNFGIPINDVTRKATPYELDSYNQSKSNNQLMNNNIRFKNQYNTINNTKSYRYEFDYRIIPFNEGIELTKPEEMLVILNRHPLVG